MTQAFVTLDTGVRLAYVEQGPADGTPMILLHGVTDSWRSFEWVLPHLPPSVHAFAVSQRGHGDSSRPADRYLFSDLSEDVRAFMDAVGLPAAVIVGHSMGASVAQRFAIDHPARVLGLLLAGSFATLHGDPELTDFYVSSIAGLRDPIDPGFARDWQLSTLARTMPPDRLAIVVEETCKVPSHVWRSAFAGFLGTKDFTDELRRIAVPTMLVWGDRDGYATREAQDRLMAAIPGARLVVYEGGGHAVHWEDPERFARDLDTWIEGVPAGTVGAQQDHA